MRGSVVNTPGDVGVDLAGVGAEGGGQGHGGGVRAAPAEGGDLPVDGHPLEPGHHRHRRRRRAWLAQPVAPDLEDLGPGVGGVGDHPGLAPGEGDGVHPEVGQGHAQQGHGDPLARAEQHVDLPVGLHRAHVAGQADQVVGGLAHGADHHDDVVAGPPGAGHVVGHGTDAVGVADRRASELLHHERHGPQGYSPAPGVPAGPGRPRRGRRPAAAPAAPVRTGYPAGPWEPRNVNVRRPAARPAARPSRRRPSASGASAGASPSPSWPWSSWSGCRL